MSENVPTYVIYGWPQSCRFRLDKCPICREPYKQLIRNRMAETIGRFFVTPCKEPLPAISGGSPPPPAVSVVPPPPPPLPFRQLDFHRRRFV